MTNLDEIAALYRKITVLEMVEKLKNCGLVWNRLSAFQFEANIVQDGDHWDLFLTKMPNQNTVVLDLRKNANYFYSLNSSTEDYLDDLFNQINEDEYFARDKEITSYLQTVEGCS